MHWFQLGLTQEAIAGFMVCGGCAFQGRVVDVLLVLLLLAVLPAMVCFSL